MPKPTSSPSRHHHHHQKKFSGAGGERAYNPTLWAKPRPMGSDSSEPNSPKVTCAGQIKVSSKTKRSSPCKNWQSVMEEIEKLHNHKKHKKRLNWVEALGIKKDIMQFLTCLQSLKFDFRCFGSVPNSDILSDDDEEEDEEEEEEEEEGIGGIDEGDDESSRTVFSKWFMVLQENQNRGFEEQEQEQEEEPCAPPSNALLLMRCRSAPAKSWLEEREEEEEEEERRMEEEEEEEEEKRKKGDEGGLMVMGLGYDSDFYKISSDIAKETWVVGGIRDLLSRSKSSKR